MNSKYPHIHVYTKGTHVSAIFWNQISQKQLFSLQLREPSCITNSNSPTWKKKQKKKKNKKEQLPTISNLTFTAKRQTIGTYQRQNKHCATLGQLGPLPKLSTVVNTSDSRTTQCGRVYSILVFFAMELRRHLTLARRYIVPLEALFLFPPLLFPRPFHRGETEDELAWKVRPGQRGPRRGHREDSPLGTRPRSTSQIFLFFFFFFFFFFCR